MGGHVTPRCCNHHQYIPVAKQPNFDQWLWRSVKTGSRMILFFLFMSRNVVTYEQMVTSCLAKNCAFNPVVTQNPHSSVLKSPLSKRDSRWEDLQGPFQLLLFCVLQIAPIPVESIGCLLMQEFIIITFSPLVNKVPGRSSRPRPEWFRDANGSETFIHSHQPKLERTSSSDPTWHGLSLNKS